MEEKFNENEIESDTRKFLMDWNFFDKNWSKIEKIVEARFTLI